LVGLSKSRILLHRQCPKRLWLQANRPELAGEDAGATARMAAGTRVGEVARDLYPGGVLIEESTLSQALASTATELARARRPVFEATLEADGVLVRVDLLLPDKRRYRIVEVKSATSVKDYYLEDAAVQAWVAREAGVPLSRVEIAHINSAFIYPGDLDYRGLFTHVDVTEAIAPLVEEVPIWSQEARETLAGGEPAVEVGDQCSTPFACPFQNYCWPPADPDSFPPEILPRGRKTAAQLRSDGFADLRDVPEGHLSNATHIRIWRASATGEIELNRAAAELLRSLPFSRYFLDFETIQFAVPIWAGTRPYMQIPFQWSCHVEDATGNVTHREFLAGGNGDPRRPFVDSLIAALDRDGPIFVYNAGFEGARMKELGAAFPEAAPQLDAAIARFVDLLPLTRDNYYHPAMRGSWSIKAVLPTIAPELSYDQLEVADGGTAMQAFAEMLSPDCDEERVTNLRRSLLAYCERDTLALVRLTRFLEEAD